MFLQDTVAIDSYPTVTTEWLKLNILNEVDIPNNVNNQ